MDNIRVGHINFLNVLPLTYSYKNGYDQDLSIMYDVPSALNEAIKSSRLDISPVSSITYARMSDELLLIPDICIRADLDVESIVLISRKPIEDIMNDKIILTAKSATSHCLLKIIMTESYGAAPVYDIRHINVDKPVHYDAVASLFIGDDALYMYLNTPKDLYCYDIGKEWHKLTGRSMVYAVWTVRKDFARNYPKLLQFAYDKILSGLENGIKNKSAAINSIINEKPFTYEILDHYLGGIIKWNLPEDAVESLVTFYNLAYKLKLIDSVPPIEFADVARMCI